MQDEQAPTGPSRRVVLAGAGAAAVAVLGGCATYGAGNAPPPDADAGEEDDDSGLTEEPQPSEGETKTPQAIAQTSDVPVGGGTVLDRRKLVITQPQAGTFKAFSAVCTHQGCIVAEVRNGTINCPCHGSAFRIADGSVAQGPARAPLTEKKIRVNGSAITLG
jgi:Rieske Fe-S protein